MATGRTAITKTDLAGAFQLLSEELHKAVSEGYVVKLPFGSFYLSASGTFSSIFAFFPLRLRVRHPEPIQTLAAA